MTNETPTIVSEKPHEQEALSTISDLHETYTDLLAKADAARTELHEAVRHANRVLGIKQETIGEALGGVGKSRVHAIITNLDNAESSHG